MDDLIAFVDELARVTLPPLLANPYAGEQAARRRANLLRYLVCMRAVRPSVLLVGEAPGHRGCAATGVPFTSASILLAEDPTFGLFGRSAGFRAGPDTAAAESSATMMWATLRQLGALPLLWNALPFHPHASGNGATNRTPSRAESALGEPYLHRLLALYDIQQVIAVGKQAALALEVWHIPAVSVRHPSHGGKTAFTSQLRLALERNGEPRIDTDKTDIR